MRQAHASRLRTGKDADPIGWRGEGIILGYEFRACEGKRPAVRVRGLFRLAGFCVCVRILGCLFGKDV